jgi:DNA-binding PadR family transcriptional regulator
LGRITSGPPRKYYGLTEIGQTFLKELSGTWTELSDAVNLITNQNNSHEQNCKYKSRRNDFHIDEDAYQKLTRYFDAIKRSLSNSSGHDEI